MLPIRRDIRFALPAERIKDWEHLLMSSQEIIDGWLKLQAM